MSQSATFGIVGAYGATGRVLATELLDSPGGILIGGRDAARLGALSSQLGGSVSAARVDVFDPYSLEEFCSHCSVILNCAGPVTSLQDRVAQAAFGARCHYVDLAGMSVVRERMLARQSEIAGLGLTFAVSSGWMPGLTELLPANAYALAKARMDSVESVAVYFSDSGEWSDTALRDAYLRETGLPKPGYFERGSWKPVKQSEASTRADPGGPVGKRRFTMFSLAEQKDLGPHFNDCDFRTYSYLAGFQNAMAAVMIALLPLSEASCVQMMRNVFRRNRLPVGGFVAVHVLGRSAGRRAALNLRMIFEHGRDYWTNAIVMATAARMVAAGNHVKPGVHFLFDAVEPLPFLAELTKSGVNIVETCEEPE